MAGIALGPTPELIYRFLHQPFGEGGGIPTAQKQQRDREVRNLPEITASGGGARLQAPALTHSSASVSGIRNG